MQPYMQAVKRCQAPAKPRGGDMISQHQDMLANQRTEEKWKHQITRKSSTTTTVVPSDTFHPHCSGRADVCLSGHMLKVLLKRSRLAPFWFCLTSAAA